jgi:hypothetical protein
MPEPPAALDGGSSFRWIWSMGGVTVVAVPSPVSMRTYQWPRGPLTGDLSTRLVRESGWPMSTAVSSLAAHPLYAAVAFAHFGVPDGYVAPHDSPAAYARAVDAARAIARP